jgi:hypothetical protein
MLTLVLPYLVAGRDLADKMVDHLDEKPYGQVVAVDARKLASGSRSFAGQLVRRIAADGGASQLLLIGAPEQFAAYVADAARALGVNGKVDYPARLPTQAQPA